jgi:hypothetical protein
MGDAAQSVIGQSSGGAQAQAQWLTGLTPASLSSSKSHSLVRPTPRRKDRRVDAGQPRRRLGGMLSFRAELWSVALTVMMEPYLATKVRRCQRRAPISQTATASRSTTKCCTKVVLIHGASPSARPFTARGLFSRSADRSRGSTVGCSGDSADYWHRFLA